MTYGEAMKPTFGKTAALKMAKHATVPLPVVKPIVHEEWLQDYLNEHPAIGDIKLLKALEQAMRQVVAKETEKAVLEVPVASCLTTVGP